MIKPFVIALFCLLPLNASAAYISGVDDVQEGRELKITPEIKQQLDDAVLTYYQDPKPEKIDTILDIIANTEVLDRKTASPPMVGFFAVVFPANKNHVMRWMSRNDYYPTAQDVIVNGLGHGGMRESALLFVKAHQWEEHEIETVRTLPNLVDLKKLKIVVPGHIDTLWGAFFGSGDVTYVNLIIEHLLNGKLPAHAYMAFSIPEDSDPLAENKLLAATTLRDYARDHKPVREALEQRYNAEPENSPKRNLLKEILGK